ncbi:hypothetical protein [Williamsia phyllosphaerae]|uniref:hypothetical protein n=1 Tax=Williamsia phyllosphaerae TaxID=885042 RepID=UPI001662FE90|nr:hypothetical protein [Williamsia phyllosphaerae]
MIPTWRQIRALNYGTIGRTVHGAVRRLGLEEPEEIWFDPPGRWQTAVAGQTTLIVTPSDRYSRTSDAMVHTDMTQDGGGDVVGPGGDGRALVAAHLNWPVPGQYDPPSVGEPTSIEERTVHGRRGWQVVFATSPIRSSEQTFVIDAETGLAIAWQTENDVVEMLWHEMDEVFSDELFRWTGQTIEYENENVRWRRNNEAKQERLMELPRSVPGWVPTAVSTHTADGDPRTGAVDASVYAYGPSVMLRRWPTGSNPPRASPEVASHTQHAQISDAVWTHELRWQPGTLTDEDAARTLESVFLMPPLSGPMPGSVEAEGAIFSGPVAVEYSQYYMPSGDGEWSGDMRRAFAGQRNGLVGTREPANVVLVCGLHTGTITVTLEIRAERPEPEVDAWDEIVEASWTVESRPWLMGFTDDAPGTVLPISPGTYRIRYCAKNMDAARDADVGEFIDSYLITIWPSVIEPDQVIKQTSDIADYWNNQAHR